MNKRKLVASRQGAWQRFEALLDKLGRQGISRLTASEIAEFSRLFRETCYDLALIRSRDWSRGLVRYLNHLVTRGHTEFYRTPPAQGNSFLRFLAGGFPRLFRQNGYYFLASALLFFAPLAVTWAIVQYDPSYAGRIVDADQLTTMDTMYSEHPTARESGDTDFTFGDQRAMMAGFYIQHNVGIALQCFARGILLGVGTVYTLVYNGISLGAVSGYLLAHGHGDRFLSFVVSHGSFELTAIAVAGGAGLMLGDAFLHPGRRSRIEALRERGGAAIQIASGAAVMLGLAALIEAFWSPAPIPAALKYAVGGLLWVLVALYLALAGREEAAP